MALDRDKYNTYLKILEEELLPALGCTEPIAIAYAGAKAREHLERFPDRIIVKCSGNIIKNTKSVIVPNTGYLKGIEASVLMGVVAGDASKGMEVLEGATKEDIGRVKDLLDQEICQVQMLKGVGNLHIIVELIAGDDRLVVELVDSHTNIKRVEKNGVSLFSKEGEGERTPGDLADRSLLNVRDIFEFANTLALEDVDQLLKMQVEYNLRIAEEGLKKNYGVNIGKMLLECYGDNILTKVRAYAAAGSDARMDGCGLPVVTNSGSGNQGIATSLPVIIYAQEKGIDREKMYRALVLANLITIHQKTGIGRLSAYCGAVSAACGSGTGITYLEGGSLDQIEKTIVNTLANVAGIVCDGAKASCAAKIASSLDAAIMAHFLAMKDTAFEEDSGIVKGTVENTISAVSRLGREGMKETDIEVLKIMLDE